jgi:hypothetical protein
VLIISLNNSIKASEKADNFKKLSQTFLLLVNEIDDDEKKDLHLYNIKYNNLINSIEFSDITERIKKQVNNYFDEDELPLQIKIVDFIIKEQLVEITGYAYEKWKQDFDTKINLLHTTYPNKKIVIISSSDKVQELKEKHSYYATVLNLDNEKEIINYFLSLL